MQDVQLSKHFRLKEFVCPDGCEGERDMNALLIYGLEQLREELGKMMGEEVYIKIISGFRCPHYNATLRRSSKNSQHMRGRAADIMGIVKRTEEILDEETLKKSAEKIPLFNNGGIGLYNNSIHVDVRPNRARWDWR